MPPASHENPSPQSVARWHRGVHVPDTHWSMLAQSLVSSQ
jgi:hypothetical protein